MQSKTDLKYYVLDVFTSERFKGNPLAVVVLEEELELQQYKDIAKEFRYAETSFIQLQSNGQELKVRSFTPAGIEVNGAGHNLLGAIHLSLLKKLLIYKKDKSDRYVVMAEDQIHYSIGYTSNDENLQQSYLSNGRENGASDSATATLIEPALESSTFVSMLQQRAISRKAVPKEDVAKAIGLKAEDLTINGLAPTVVSTEVSHLVVPVKNSNRLNEAIGNKELLNELGQKYGFEGCYLFSPTKNNSYYLAEARFFNPGIGIDEDAATGSAAGPLAGFLYLNGEIRKEKSYSILQGAKMNQPSTIHFRVSDEGIWVGGTSVVVMEGNLYL